MSTPELDALVVIAEETDGYRQETGREARFWVSKAAQGAGPVPL